MKRRAFIKVCSSLAGLGHFSDGAKAFEAANGAERALLLSSSTAHATLNARTSDVSVFGLGGFGSRMVSRLDYDVKSSFEGVDSRPAFFAQDADKDLILQSTSRMSASSLVILMAGLGGTTGTTLIHELAQQVRRTGALTVAVVTIPEGDPVFAHNLLRLRDVSDVVFAKTCSAQPLAGNPESVIAERARSLLDAEKWMLRGVGGLLRAVAIPSRTTLGVHEIRALFSGADDAVYASATCRDGREIGSAIQQALTRQKTDIRKKIRAALIVVSGPAEQLRWPNIEAGKDEIQNLLGSVTPCLFGVQANNWDGYFRVQTEVWLALS